MSSEYWRIHTNDSYSSEEGMKIRGEPYSV